jgi:AcrR family transcriptional regulator
MYLYYLNKSGDEGMGTKKTEKAFDWIELSDQEQCQWAAQYLWKEAVKGSILLGPNDPISPGTLEYLFANLQAEHNKRGRDTVLDDLDRRMRRAWDEIKRRRDPNTKAYQFRMSKALTGKLGWLRRTWKEPISTIVERLITEAHDKGKTEAAKVKAQKSRDRHINRTSKLLLQLERDLKKAEGREKALEKLAEDLTHMLCIAEHKLQKGLPQDARLDPEAAKSVDESAKASTEAYLEGIEADLRHLQLPEKLRQNSQRAIQNLNLATPGFNPQDRDNSPPNDGTR